MKLSLATPALLFSAISLLLLAYTNRFLTIAQLVRNLHAKYKENRDKIIYGQIRNLRQRINLIRNMQIFGLISLLLCVICMFLLYIEWNAVAEIVFGLALILLIISLALSAWEIQISVRALNLHLSDIEEL
jgi:glucose uptake protein GlcU